MIDFIVREKVYKQIHYKINLSLDEIKFYSSSKIKFHDRGDQSKSLIEELEKP